MSKHLFRRTLVLGLSTALLMGSLSGCGKKSEATATPGDSAQQEYAVTVTPASLIDENTSSIQLTKDGKILDDLTGEWIDASFANKRPVAVMINNLEPAMPQAGIGQADLIYEMTVEGGITRLMAVFTDYSGLDKIGPVRSARHYFDRTAMGLDAIYVHVGQSYLAQADFDTYPQLDDINGLTESGFYRTSDRVAPHNCYTSTDGINQQIAADGYDVNKSTDYVKSFQFKSEDSSIHGNPAKKITTAFNSGRKPWFTYDENTGLYLRYQYGTEQIDENTNSQLAFKNVIIQFAPHEPIPNEDILININLVGNGDGYYASDGEIIPITWTRSSDTSETHYYTADGKQLEMNPGKTWITIFPDSNKEGIIIESTDTAEESTDAADTAQ